MPYIGILTRFFLASSIPLRIASGTSPDLPRPKPNCAVSVSYYNKSCKLQDTSALNCLGNSVIETTFSESSNAFASILAKSITSFLELQSVFTSSFSKLFYSSVIKVAASVKYNFSYSLFNSALSNHCSDLTCAFNVSAVSFKFLYPYLKRNRVLLRLRRL